MFLHTEQIHLRPLARMLMLFGLLAFCPTTTVHVVAAQEQKSADEIDPNEVKSTASQAATLPTVDEIKAAREAAAADTTLDEATRTLLDQHLAKTLEHLAAAEAAATATRGLSEELKTAPQEIPKLQQALTAPLSLPTTQDKIKELSDLDALQQLLAETESALTNSTQRLKTARDELDRRSTRRPQIPELQTANKQQLDDLEKQLAAPPPENERADVQQALNIRFRAKKRRLQLESEQYLEEQRTYETTNPLWALRRDIADRESQELAKLVKALQSRIGAVKQEVAQQEAEAARVAALRADPAIRKEAKLNAALAEDKLGLLASIEKTQERLNKRSAELATRITDFETLKKRSETSGFSQAIGVLLRNQQSALPDVDRLRAEARKLQPTITDLDVDIIDWESQRRQLVVDLDGQVEELVTQLSSQFDESYPGALEAEVRELLSSRLKLYQDLIANGNAELDQLVTLDTELKKLSQQIETEQRWLAEHVLWVRSARWIGAPSTGYAESVQLLTRRQDWQIAASRILSHVEQEWMWFAGLALSFIFILAVRQRLKRRIREYGEQAQKSTMIEFQSTIATAVLTVAISLPAPLLVWLLGRSLILAASGNVLVNSLGNAVKFGAEMWAVIELIRLTAQVNGLGEAHFNWPRKVTRSIRRFAHLLTLTLLPPGCLASFLENLGQDQISSSVGRLSFILMMIALTNGLYQLLNAESPARQAVSSTDPRSLLRRTSHIWPALTIFAPLVLAVLSAAGYHYTAVQLTSRLAVTLLAMMTVLLISQLLTRWRLITYRRLAIQRSREQRQQASAEAGSVANSIPAAADAGLKLTDINSQASQLIRVTGFVVLVGSLWAIWSDVLPALGILNQVELWPNHLLTTDEGIPAVWITAGDLVGAILITVITLLASRNLPGLMELTVLQRLPLDAGARYAATSVCRYLIVVTGVVFAFRQIGIGWSSVQWLVAAMSVGLGFGLQEIFANFVSGIILLFERPIRVGDVVTIGSHTGKIVRIRIRATTLVDWDQKDVVIPNREFVTGQVVNWTLTSVTMRLIIPVGVAYGSDTDLTEKLLYQAARENPNITEDPATVVVFAKFGDNTLNFELRTYIHALSLFLETTHQLHRRIDQLFRENNIEIAFPQRDLHIKSMPQNFAESAYRTPHSETA